MSPRIFNLLLVPALSLTGLATVAPARAQMSIVDIDSYANAIRTTKIIDQQVQQLQNEAQVLLKMDKHLKGVDFPQLQPLLDKLNRIDQLMGQAQSVDFRVDQLDAKLQALFPRNFDQALGRDQRLQAARNRYEASKNAYLRTMQVQSRIVEDAREDAEAIAAIAARSQGAEGSLAAQQASNQLLAITAKQQLALQQMMAAQLRSDAIEKQRQLTQSEEARAATKRFIGSGKAYTPR